jgi:hypothetical protein
MRKCANISPYMRRLLVVYDFATAPFSISLYMRRIFSLQHRQQQEHLMLLRAGMSERAGIQQQGHLQHPSDVATAGMPVRVGMEHQRLLQHHSDVANSRDASKSRDTCNTGMPAIIRTPSKDCSKQKHHQQQGHCHNLGQNLCCCLCE